MNPLETQLSYPFEDTLPKPGDIQRVCAGVYWLPMGLPFALNHINLWLLEDDNGWTIIDCGISNDDTKANWEIIFALHLNGKPVTRVIATHCHPDHLGLADWLCERWQVSLWMSAGEYSFGRMMQAGLSGVEGSSTVPHFQRHGVTDPALVEQLLGRKNYYPTLVPSVPTAYVRMQEHQLIHIGAHHWRVITGFGHSPEHVSLYCDELRCLISGDMLLPRISTNVSVWAIEPYANPVQQFLDSLDKYCDLESDTLVLPSHGKPFKGIHIRVQQLIDHHHARLAEVLVACVTPQSANDIVPIMFLRPLDTHQLTFALGEALAHLHLLWFAGKLQRKLGEDGIYRFVRS
ncbi:MBL fold metallo-hydrolase [Solimicrobium silvestre]|uniref:Metallo-beta-lactamase superfamily n=1 Tax=Solimicrobium silvestre TaxID=2099400 RepID=A0A2S9H054_9BURK|nr:MBL fold metallo-hydrolase [Solimicrobium silvestre]PRC93347.1 Metallo-beta-lactamase superfamily [Solimicrobium silvestre]